LALKLPKTIITIVLIGTLAIPGLSAVNRGIFNQFTPVAPTNDSGFITVAGRQIPVGNVAFSAPSFSAQNYFVTNFDVTQSKNTQHKVRYSHVNTNFSDTAANLPVFFSTLPSKQ
jgi:hypothetical protein